jgi:hypothetical protein
MNENLKTRNQIFGINQDSPDKSDLNHSPHYPLEVAEYRPAGQNSHGSLQGYVKFSFPDTGMVIDDFYYHQDLSTGRKWIQFPSTQYRKKSGGRGFHYFLSFPLKSDLQRFQRIALGALDAFLGESRRKKNENRP